MTRTKQTARKRTTKSQNPDRVLVQNEREEEYKAKNNVSYASIVKENVLFEKYYRQLNLIDESEFDEFMEILKKPLPITFRITSYKSFAKELLKTLKEKHFKYLDEIVKEDNGELVKSAAGGKGSSLLHANAELAKETDEEVKTNSDKKIYKSLEWYPNEMAWQVELSRQDVRKNIHFDEFKRFLIQQTQNGYVSRQEAVSMIPPLMLDIEPHHKILDMCAAPGSKTAQLIEFLHKDKSNPCPDGFVIANELDNKRCYMLMHQLKRLESPNFMIINHDASSLPNFRTESADAPSAILTYDRILADVPCSGDGTFRKNIDIWAKWNSAHACNLHGIQARIANRSAELLKPGGLMVYSTCSLNPVENEAVVYNLLLKFKGQLELVDARHKLPGLKTLKGLSTWNLMNKQGDIYQTAEDVPEQFKHLIKPYMFPPELKIVQELNLDRCIRVMPHHQDTGGFFIAVIRKLEINAPLSADLTQAESERTAPTDKHRVMKAPPAKRLKHVYEENPFQFLDSNNTLLNDWTRIKEFFKISDEFPVGQMMTRNKKGENVRNVYFVSKQIRDLTVNNGDRIKFINMGLPLFSRADIKDPSNIELRISQESLDIVTRYFGKRIIHINDLTDLIKVLRESTPGLIDFSEYFQEQIKEQCDSQGGSIILVWQPKDEANNSELPIAFTAWLGKATLRPLVNIDLRRFFLTMVNLNPDEISEICSKIKAEDEMNSKKSQLNNPQYKPKVQPEAKEEVLDENDHNLENYENLMVKEDSEDKME